VRAPRTSVGISPPTAGPARSRAAAALGPTLVLLGVVNLATAAWAAVDHASFAAALAPFGPVDGHLLDDYAAASATFGAALLAAAAHPPWRVPLVAVNATWAALHAASHLAAADHPDAGATGPLEAAALIAATLALLAILVVAERSS
jgi:hypothetical protein